MRVLRIFKLSEYLVEAMVMQRAIKASLKRISVFLLAVLALVIIIGAAIYVIEDGQNGFTDIPTSIYWAIVTLTTVGYGDIAPKTAPGKILAPVVKLLGYGMIAVPPVLLLLSCQKFHMRHHHSGTVHLAAKRITIPMWYFANTVVKNFRYDRVITC